MAIVNSGRLLDIETEIESLLLAKQYLVNNDKTNYIATLTAVRADLLTIINNDNALSNVSLVQ